MSSRALSRRAGLVALAIGVVLCLAGIFQHGLWTPDEPREAEIAREMLTSHFSAVPTLSGEPFLEKPPLFAWITAAFYAVFGVSASVARLPAALFSIGAIGVAYLLGKRAAGRLAGLCSAIVLATMWQFAETSHKAVLDIALTFFVAAGHLAFLRLRDDKNAANYVAIGVLSGLAFLTKAWIGPALLCAPPILAAAAMRDWDYVKRVLPRAFVAAVLGVAAFGLPWVFAVAHAPNGGWGAVKETLVTEYVGRTVGGAEFRKSGHSNPPWYYLHTALLVAVPWVLALPAMLKGGTLARTGRRGTSLWLLLVFVAGLVILSIPSGKRDIYLLPLLPALAVPFGVWLSRVGTRRGGSWDTVTCRTLAIVAWSVTTLLVVGIAWMALGGPLPASVTPEMRERLAWGVAKAGRAATVIGIASLLAAIWVKRRRGGGRAHPAFAVAWALVMLFLVLHGAVRPFLDPLRDMSEGARQATDLVPADEPLLAFSADETTLAVLPFYSGRLVTNAEKPTDAIRALESGPEQHLLVMDKDVKRLGAALEKRLTLVRTVRLSATREISVYALKP